MFLFKHFRAHIDNLIVVKIKIGGNVKSRVTPAEYLRYLLCLPLQLEESPRNMQKCQRFGQCMMKFRSSGYYLTKKVVTFLFFCFVTVWFNVWLTEWSICSLTLTHVLRTGFRGLTCSIFLIYSLFIIHCIKKSLKISKHISIKVGFIEN